MYFHYVDLACDDLFIQLVNKGWFDWLDLNTYCASVADEENPAIGLYLIETASLSSPKTCVLMCVLIAAVSSDRWV